jgi:hypothetical protein
MTEDIAVFNGRDFSAIKVKIGTTNCSSCDSEDDVVTFLNYWVGNRIDFHAVGAVVGKCSHNQNPFISQLVNGRGARVDTSSE